MSGREYSAREYIVTDPFSPNYGKSYDSAEAAMVADGWVKGEDGLYRQHPENLGYSQPTALWLARIRPIMEWDEVTGEGEA